MDDNFLEDRFDQIFDVLLNNLPTSLTWLDWDVWDVDMPTKYCAEAWNRTIPRLTRLRHVTVHPYVGGLSCLLHPTLQFFEVYCYNEESIHRGSSLQLF